MNDNEKLSLEQIRAFLEGSEGTGFHSTDKREVYEWVNRTLRQQGYERLKRRAKGLVRRYMAKMTGLATVEPTSDCWRHITFLRPIPINSAGKS